MDDCPVCLEEPAPGARCVLACTHAFCADCVAMVLSRGAPRCPVCRRDIATRPTCEDAGARERLCAAWSAAPWWDDHVRRVRAENNELWLELIANGYVGNNFNEAVRRMHRRRMIVARGAGGDGGPFAIACAAAMLTLSAAMAPSVPSIALRCGSVVISVREIYFRVGHLKTAGLLVATVAANIAVHALTRAK